jgi:hypothetical protein
MFRNIVKKLTGYDNWNRRFGMIDLHARVAIAFSRAAATMAARTIDPYCPSSWEFTAFSQHGEDGITDHLCEKLVEPTRFFLEIGAADGVQNCTAWLAFGRQYGGMMVEGDAGLINTGRAALQDMNWSIQFVHAFVSKESACKLLKRCPFVSPDFFSLDIDGIDYYIADAMFTNGFRPKIVVVEYNSAFGPANSITVPYKPTFARFHEHSSGVYYGVSIAAWRVFFERHGYRFVTVDRSGTNAFFIDPSAFSAGYADKLKGTDFLVNTSDLTGATRPTLDPEGDFVVRRPSWLEQFAMVKGLPFVTVS